jgi:hypothetical protein
MGYAYIDCWKSTDRVLCIKEGGPTSDWICSQIIYSTSTNGSIAEAGVDFIIQ